MSAAAPNFAPMARQLLAMLEGPARFSDAQLVESEVGRRIADELVQTLRSGNEAPDFLMAYITLALKSPGEGPRGFFRELQTILEASPCR